MKMSDTAKANIRKGIPCHLTSNEYDMLIDDGAKVIGSEPYDKFYKVEVWDWYGTIVKVLVGIPQW